MRLFELTDYCFVACVGYHTYTRAALPWNCAVVGHMWVDHISDVEVLTFTPIVQKGTCSSVIFRPRKRFSGYIDLLWRTKKRLSWTLRSDQVQPDSISWDRDVISCCSCNHTRVCSLECWRFGDHLCHTQHAKLERASTWPLFYVSTSAWYLDLWPMLIYL